MPSLRYGDVEAAIEWLGDAFGFEEHDVAAEADGAIRHAQLTLGSDMIMLLPALPTGTDARDQSCEIGGAETQSLYFVVDDVEAHYRRALAAGADILENGEFAFGGRGYSCRDPEGHIWHFGTFNPRRQGAGDGAWIREFLYGERARSLAARLRDRLNPPVLVAAAVAGVVAAAIFGWMLFALPQMSASAKERGLAFRARLVPQAEEAGVRPPAGADAPVQLSIAPAEPLSAAGRTEDASKPAGQQPDGAARRTSSAVASAEATRRGDEGPDRDAQQTVEETLDKVRIARQAADRAGEQALSRLQAAQEATAPSPPPEAQEESATAPTEAREQQTMRERAGKQSAAKDAAVGKAAAKEAAARKAAERASKEARSWQAETRRAKPSPAQPANVPAQQPQATDAGGQGAWNCAPSAPSGQIVCHPPGKKEASAKAPVSARQQHPAVETRSEPSAERQAAVQEPPQDQTVGAQLWDCQPSPPNGHVICRPIGGRGRATP
jgi:uncharacterized glyoxalase superfamily protein PhnB